MEGHHLVVLLQPNQLRVHKVVLTVRVRIGQLLTVQDQTVLEAEDPIALVQLGQEYLNLRQTVAVARFHPEHLWVAPMIQRVFVHELLNR